MEKNFGQVSIDANQLLGNVMLWVNDAINYHITGHIMAFPGTRQLWRHLTENAMFYL